MTRAPVLRTPQPIQSSQSVPPGILVARSVRSPPVTTPTPPSDAPSEPRAMKNIPKGPRSLLTRAKELEERLARSKVEIPRSAEKETVTFKAPITNSSDASSKSSVDKQAVEENLRRLVLQSRKLKAGPTVSKAATQTGVDVQEPSVQQPALATMSQHAIATPMHALTSTASKDMPVVPPSLPESAASTSASYSMDDLAVSFINDAVQAVGSSAGSKKTSTSVVKMELAAKQKMLEDHISETKTLMAQLNSASTKAEKDRILVVLRERGR